MKSWAESFFVLIHFQFRIDGILYKRGQLGQPIGLPVFGGNDVVLRYAGAASQFQVLNVVLSDKSVLKHIKFIVNINEDVVLF